MLNLNAVLGKMAQEKSVFSLPNEHPVGIRYRLKLKPISIGLRDKAYLDASREIRVGDGSILINERDKRYVTGIEVTRLLGEFRSGIFTTTRTDWKREGLCAIVLCRPEIGSVTIVIGNDYYEFGYLAIHYLDGLDEIAIEKWMRGD